MSRDWGSRGYSFIVMVRLQGENHLTYRCIITYMCEFNESSIAEYAVHVYEWKNDSRILSLTFRAVACHYVVQFERGEMRGEIYKCVKVKPQLVRLHLNFDEKFFRTSALDFGPILANNWTKENIRNERERREDENIFRSMHRNSFPGSIRTPSGFSLSLSSSLFPSLASDSRVSRPRATSLFAQLVHSHFHGSPSIRRGGSLGRTCRADSLRPCSNLFFFLASARAFAHRGDRPSTLPRELEINLGKR